jgi:peptide/nickel transport system ATP-binding protein
VSGTAGSAALLSVTGLRVSYPARGGGRLSAVDGVDLSIRPGEVLALVGESGSGKSSIAHALIGLLPTGGRVDAGSVRLGGMELVGLGERRFQPVRGRRIGLVPQDPAVSLNPVRRVGEQVAESLRIHGLADRRGAAAAAVRELERVGLPAAALRARQYPHELSGGMRQRVLIAIALAAGPELLIADEPTSALDVTVQRQILDQLARLVAESDTAVLLITHDLGVARDRADRIAVLSGGRIVDSGPAGQLVRDPGHPYTRALVEAAPSLGTRPPPELTAPGAPLLVADGLVKTFPLPGRGQSVRAVDGVGFTIGRGETLALVGESGSGKSTLARLVLRLAEPDAGRVVFDGQDVTGVRRGALRGLRRRMQVVYQNPYASLDPRFSI